MHLPRIPARGLYILIFLAVVIGGSLSLYALRAPSIRSSGQFEIFSRETALLINNVLLLVAMLTILVGTLYPLVCQRPESAVAVCRQTLF